MAHVIHSINTTASGLCHHMDSAIDGSHHQYAIDLTLSADALIFGRSTFDLFARFWPDAVDRDDLPKGVLDLAKAFDSVLKFVVSSRPVEQSWNNTRHVHGPCVARELERLSGRVVIFGSSSLASSLLNDGLVNEVHILAQPYIGVEGPRAFSGLKERVCLNLQGASSLASGSVLLRYNVT